MSTADENIRPLGDALRGIGVQLDLRTVIERKDFAVADGGLIRRARRRKEIARGGKTDDGHGGKSGRNLQHHGPNALRKPQRRAERAQAFGAVERCFEAVERNLMRKGLREPGVELGLIGFGPVARVLARQEPFGGAFLDADSTFGFGDVRVIAHGRFLTLAGSP
jgi:hypothetical protein